jgi:hypothetical protein
MSPSDQAASYRLYAAYCIEIAQHLADARDRAQLLMMAQAWRAFAEQAEKNLAITLVYETPEPRQQGAQLQQQPQPTKE